MPDEHDRQDLQRKIAQHDAELSAIRQDIGELTQSVRDFVDQSRKDFRDLRDAISAASKFPVGPVLTVLGLVLTLVIVLISAGYAITQGDQRRMSEITTAKLEAITARIDGTNELIALSLRQADARLTGLEKWPAHVRWMQGVYDEAIANLKADADHRRDTVDEIMRREINDGRPPESP